MDYSDSKRNTPPKAERLTVDLPAVYRIRIAGHLDQSWSNRLGGMQISISKSELSHEVSTLSGTVADQAALFGVLKALYDMRIPLISVDCLEIGKNL